MATWIIEGEWSGYTSSQCRVVHREYTTSRKYADKVSELGFIQYTDGTTLNLRVRLRTKSDGKRQPVINGYNSLIRDCVYHGTNSVESLAEKRKQ